MKREREPGLAGVDFEALHAVQQRVLLHLSLGQSHLGSGELHLQTFVLLQQHLQKDTDKGHREASVCLDCFCIIECSNKMTELCHFLELFHEEAD